MQSLAQPGSQAEQVGRLLIAVALVVWLPAFPFGEYLVYPFYLLNTWFHEMGHGMTALVMGQHFEQLVINADGSGVAESYVSGDTPAIINAAIAGGGPMAPSIVGSLLIVASAHPKLWRPVLVALAAAIFVSVFFYVAGPVGRVVLPLVGGLMLLVAWRANDALTRFTLQFLGVLAAMSMLQDWDYLFSEQGMVGGQMMTSDTGQIEASLWLPHWFWAAAIIVISAVMIGASLKYALAENRRKPPPKKPKPPANVLQFRR